MSTYRLLDGQSGRPGIGSSGTQVPTAPTSYSGDYSAGLVFQVTSGGLYFEGYWWYVPAGGDASSAANFALWQITGTNTGTFIPASEIAWVSNAFTAGAWNFVPCTPIPLTPNIPYEAVISYGTSIGFPMSQNQFGSGEPYAGGITNGPLNAYGANTGAGSATTGGIPQSPYATPTSIDPGYFMPLQNDENDLLWLDVQVTDQVPAKTPERAWPNMLSPWPAATPQSTDKTLGLEFSLSAPAALNKVWHYAPYPDTAGSYSAWGQSTANTPTAVGPAGTYTFGMEFEVSATCVLDTFWFYSAPGATSLPSAVAVYPYNVTTPLEVHTSPTWSGAAGSGWVSTPLSGTSQVFAGNSYYLAAYGTGTWWSYNTYWGSAGTGVSNGPLSVPSSAGAKNGQGVIYDGGTGITYPNTNWSTYNAWMDVTVSLANVGALPSQVAVWDTTTQAVVPNSLITNPVWHNTDGSTAHGPGWVYCDYGQSNITLPAGTYIASTYSSAGKPWYSSTPGVFNTKTPSVVQHAQLSTGGSVNAFTLTLDTATTAGNCLIVAVTSVAAGQVPSSVTLGGATDHFRLDGSATNSANPTTTLVESIWSDPNCAGGQTQVTVNFTNSS